jgi:hypothetical protein
MGHPKWGPGTSLASIVSVFNSHYMIWKTTQTFLDPDRPFLILRMPDDVAQKLEDEWRDGKVRATDD